MDYVVVDTHTGCKVTHPRTRKETWSSERAAKAAATRMSKILDSMGTLVVMHVKEYRAQVPQIEVMSLQSGKLVRIPADTPWHCRPDSESFWSA